MIQNRLLQIVLFLVLVCRIGLAEAQEHTEVPDWFLNPAAGEYVGVAYPHAFTGDQEQVDAQKYQEQQAVFSALFSYALTAWKDEDKHDTKIITNVGYEITRRYQRNDGELFVAIRIVPDNSRLLQIRNVENDEFSTTSWNAWSKISCTYDTWNYTLDFKEKNDTISYSIYILFGNQTGCCKFMEPHLKSKSGKRYLDMRCSSRKPERAYQYDCSESLHVAYMRALSGAAIARKKPDYPFSIVDNKLCVYEKE